MDWLIIFMAKYLIFVVVSVAIFTACTIEKRREFLIAIILATIAALDLALIADTLFYSPRPFVAQDVEPSFTHGPDNGFPSMHTVAAMTLTSVIYFYRRHVPAGTWRRFIPAVAFALTLLIGAGRVWAHVHSWIDIAGGLLIGAIAGYTGVKIARFFLSRLSARRPKVRR